MHNKTPSPLRNVLEVFKSQVIAAVIALFFVAILYWHSILSFALGEMAMLMGNAFLAWRVYRQSKTLAPVSLLLSFLGGETGKYVLLVILTIVIAHFFLQLNWLFYVIGIATPQLFGIVIYLVWNRYRK